MSRYEQPNVHELAGKKSSILIRKLRPHFDGASGGVDLVVDRKQSSFGDLRLLSAVIGIDSQFCAITRLLLNLGEVVLCNAENNGNRRELGDHHQRSGAIRLHDVARINESQTNPA